MTPMMPNAAVRPPRVNWLTRNLVTSFSFKRQSAEHLRRVRTGNKSWRRGRGRPP